MSTDQNRSNPNLPPSLTPLSRSFRRQRLRGRGDRRPAPASEREEATGASDDDQRHSLPLASSRRGGRGCRMSVHRTKSGALVRRPWLPPSFHSGREGAGEPAAIRRRQRRAARRPPACASVPRLATRQPARSSVGRERRRGVLALAGAVGAPAAPEGNRRRSGGIIR
jgi:hypothetical protein